jgi:hypothetical protein
MSEMGMDEDTIKDTMEGMAGDIEDKIAACASMILNLKAEAEAVKNEADRMAARHDSIEKEIAKLTAYTKPHMLACGLAEVRRPAFIVRHQRLAPVVEIIDEKEVPFEFWRYVPPKTIDGYDAPDKAAIAAAMKSGTPVAGCKLRENYKLVIK